MCEGFQEQAGVDDAALNLLITGHGRSEAAAAGARLAAIAALVSRRMGDRLAEERRYWICDAWDSCAAEIASDLTITHRKASAMMYQALDLRDRFPLIGALLRSGHIALRVATALSWRTHLIEDPEVFAEVDADLAKVATRFGKYSEDKLADAIDARIERHDPDAVRRFHTAKRNLDVRFGKQDDDTGTRSVFGRMSVVNAELSERRIDTMITALCPDDPRTVGERRTEAWGVIAAGGDVLPCLCGNPDCPAAGEDARGKCFDILILTDDPDAGAGVAESDEPAADSAPPTPAAPCNHATIFAGGGILPAPLLADLRRMGACVRTVVTAEDVTAEIRYRPSIALQRLVRARDMTCRFTGCDRPAEYCDLDHTIPYGPGGLTHPGNTKMLCRKHHLLKTFWVGEGGWSDRQLADGTIVWTSPSGLQHRAPPGSRIYFPNWDRTTPLPTTPAPTTEPAPGRELRMPLRKRTRAQQRADSIRAERERNRRAAADADPPPF